MQRRCLTARHFLCWCVVLKRGFVRESHIQDARCRFSSLFHVQYNRISYQTWHRRSCPCELFISYAWLKLHFAKQANRLTMRDFQGLLSFKEERKHLPLGCYGQPCRLLSRRPADPTVRCTKTNLTGSHTESKTNGHVLVLAWEITPQSFSFLDKPDTGLRLYGLVLAPGATERFLRSVKAVACARGSKTQWIPLGGQLLKNQNLFQYLKMFQPRGLPSISGEGVLCQYSVPIYDNLLKTKSLLLRSRICLPTIAKT